MCSSDLNPRLAVVVITRGTDAHGHLPAAVAGNIYRALSPRFGTQINFQIAVGPDDETPNPRDKKAAALNEEAKETKAATEAEENSEEAGTTNTEAKSPNANNVSGTEPKSKVKATSMPVGNKPKSPVKTTTPSKQGSTDANESRPRRTQPDQR